MRNEKITLHAARETGPVSMDATFRVSATRCSVTVVVIVGVATNRKLDTHGTTKKKMSIIDGVSIHGLVCGIHEQTTKLASPCKRW